MIALSRHLLIVYCLIWKVLAKVIEARARVERQKDAERGMLAVKSAVPVFDNPPDACTPS